MEIWQRAKHFAILVKARTALMHPIMLFELLASTTWRTIDHAHRNQVQFGEDAITSVNLNALASFPSTFVGFEDTRAKEAQKGCDFELWIGAKTTGWARYAIQAKKIDSISGRYRKLHYGHKISGQKQIDVLERYAKSNRALALYCFYNHAPNPPRWNCGLDKDWSQLGCSVTPASVVRAALKGRGKKNFAWIHSQLSTVPWRCLVRCPNVLRRGLYHSAWPASKYYVHEVLPDSLRHLQEENQLPADSEHSEIWNANCELRPSWIGVVDISGTIDEDNHAPRFDA